MIAQFTGSAVCGTWNWCDCAALTFKTTKTSVCMTCCCSFNAKMCTCVNLSRPLLFTQFKTTTAAESTFLHIKKQWITNSVAAESRWLELFYFGFERASGKTWRVFSVQSARVKVCLLVTSVVGKVCLSVLPHVDLLLRPINLTLNEYDTEDKIPRNLL